MCFGDDDQIVFASLSYDFALLIGDLFNSESPGLLGGKIISRLREAGERTGATGSYSFQESPETGQYFHFPIVIKEIQGGRVVVKER